MRKQLLVLAAASVGALLAGAAPGGYGQGDRDMASNGYPACSKTVTDRCIQLYESVVRSPENLAMNSRLGPGRVAPAPRMASAGMMRPAMGGPIEDVPMAPMASGPAAMSREAYPACSRTITDRCIQLYERGVRAGVR